MKKSAFPLLTLLCLVLGAALFSIQRSVDGLSLSIALLVLGSLFIALGFGLEIAHVVLTERAYRRERKAFFEALDAARPQSLGVIFTKRTEKLKTVSPKKACFLVLLFPASASGKTIEAYLKSGLNEDGLEAACKSGMLSLGQLLQVWKKTVYIDSSVYEEMKRLPAYARFLNRNQFEAYHDEP